MRSVTTRSLWRPGACVAAAATAALPLLRGEVWLAVPTVLLALAIVGGWALGAGASTTRGPAVAAGLLALLWTLFLVSQWPRGGLPPPPQDWLVAWFFLGLPAVLAALAVDRRLGGKEPGPAKVRRIVAAVSIAGLLTLCTCLTSLLALDGELGPRFEARRGEIGSLPDDLVLTSFDGCVSGGSSGNCTALFVVQARDGASRDVAVTRLLAHLRAAGWPLERWGTGKGFGACRPVDGIVPWTDHCMWLYTDADPSPERPLPDGAVVVYIDNV